MTLITIYSMTFSLDLFISTLNMNVLQIQFLRNYHSYFLLITCSLCKYKYYGFSLKIVHGNCFIDYFQGVFNLYFKNISKYFPSVKGVQRINLLMNICKNFLVNSSLLTYNKSYPFVTVDF